MEDGERGIRKVQSDEARRNFRSLLDEVEHDGLHVWVKRYNRTSAALVPWEWYVRASGLMAAEVVQEAVDHHRAAQKKKS